MDWNAYIIILCLTVSLTHGELICQLSDELKSEIANKKDEVDEIKKLVVDGDLKNITYSSLAEFLQRFGHRQTGTPNLENSIDYVVQKLKERGLENVHTETATAPHWIRGNESAEYCLTRFGIFQWCQNLPILGLGNSIGTDEDGIAGNVVVVKTFDELASLPRKKVEGKIVVYNQDFDTYDTTVLYRFYGACNASKQGAVAVLVRSITESSKYGPHTGWQFYCDGVEPIPAAAISVDDAKRLYDIYKYRFGSEITIKLKMGAKHLGDIISRNTIAEISGATIPHEMVLVSGHIDNWDVGQGAQDDAGGSFVSWMSLVAIKTLMNRNLIAKPKRTLRCILFTGEEEGYEGANDYIKNHEDEIKNYSIVMQADEGTYAPTGLKFYGSEGAACILQEILKLMEPFNSATKLKISGQPVPSDIILWQESKEKVPGASFMSENDEYLDYHHSTGDTLDKLNPTDLDLCTAFWASVAYIIADLPEKLPVKIS